MWNSNAAGVPSGKRPLQPFPSAHEPQMGPYPEPQMGPYSGPQTGPYSGPQTGPYSGPQTGPYSGPGMQPCPISGYPGKVPPPYGFQMPVGGPLHRLHHQGHHPSSGPDGIHHRGPGYYPPSPPDYHPPGNHHGHHKKPKHHKHGHAHHGDKLYCSDSSDAD